MNQLLRSSGPTSGADSEDELATLSLPTEEDEAASKAIADAAADSQLWKSKKVLRSHLDAVRSIEFDTSSSVLSLLSASDDNTIKVWKLDPSIFSQINLKSQTSTADVHPIITFRGHSAPITCLTISANQRKIFSGSLDSSIKIWKLPEPTNVGGNESYQPFDSSTELNSFVGHSQGIWDMVLLPLGPSEDSLLATASADGTLKVWSNEIQDQNDPLKLSWDYFGNEPTAKDEEERKELTEKNQSQEGGNPLPVPTGVAKCHWNLKTIVVAYSNAVVKLFEIETGKEVLKLKSDETYGE